MIDRVIQSQSVYASVAHRYWNSQWSEAENQKTYGQDSSCEGIGSNLRLELTVEAARDAGLLSSLGRLKALVDHQCLFSPESELKDRPSTLENIALWLAGTIAGDWVKLTVWESEHLGCTVLRGSKIPEITFKQNNLWLTIVREVDIHSGLAVDRASVQRAVREKLVKLNENNDSDPMRWSRDLFLDFAQSLPGLRLLKIDLGSHEALVVHS